LINPVIVAVVAELLVLAIAVVQVVPPSVDV
jgi:hypothetical protein